MSNQKVEYSDGVWDYSPKKYWVDDTQYSFVATYPYFEDFNPLDSANGDVKFTVVTPSSVDYLVATNTTDTSIEGYETTVQLSFQHVLTSVGLNIWRDGAKHQNDHMRIRKVTLSNIRKAGTYSIVDGTWAYTNDKLTAEVVNDNISDDDNIGAAVLVNDAWQYGGDVYNPFGTMMLLPQTLDASNSVSLKIEYDLKRNNAANWESAELETVLPDITWAAGRRYTYNVVLSSVTDITIYYIQTKVDQWGTPQVGATVIIK